MSKSHMLCDLEMRYVVMDEYEAGEAVRLRVVGWMDEGWTGCTVAAAFGRCIETGILMILYRPDAVREENQVGRLLLPLPGQVPSQERGKD